ncbi:MFS transporter, partial [Bacillaceae bacterium Marseille-Q3522]|nr:MFS transporter [Bacillaceae bacterium Marseille-Q3522]
IRGNNLLRNVTFSASAFLLGGAAIDAYEVLFIKNALDLGPKGYAFVVSLSGASFLIGGFVNVFISKWFDSRSLFVYGTILAVFANIMYSFSVNIYLVTISLILTGIGVTAHNTTATTILQTNIPKHLQGRVTSFQSTFPDLSSTVSVLIAGIFVPYTPIRIIVIVAALITSLALLPLFSIADKEKISFKKKSHSAQVGEK